MKKRVFIIHGWGSSPKEDFFPWLKKELAKRDFVVKVLTMPDTKNPVIRDWVDYLSNQIGRVDKNTYLVGHSIGCQTILRHLENLKEGEKTGGVILVAPWFNLIGLSDEEKIIAKPWLETKIDLNRVKETTSNLIAIFSDNDPVVPISDEAIFKEKLGAKTIIEHKKGHFNEVDGMAKVPIILKSVLEVSR